MTLLIDNSGPPRPFYVLRGHPSEVQCLHFPARSLARDMADFGDCLISGDSSGFVFIWNMSTKRPLTIWRAHTSALLTIRTIGDQILTHGRDNKIHLWTILNIEDLSSNLPIEIKEIKGDSSRQKPFLICSLDVNSLNFCQAALSASETPGETLVAVPGLLGSEYIDVFALPSTLRLATRLQAPAPAPEKGKLGNVMSIDFQYPLIAVGYENGAVALFSLDVSMVDRSQQRQDATWQCAKVWSYHKDAVLSVVLHVKAKAIYSCGIDARLIKYEYESLDGAEEVYVKETKHSGQQSMRLRSDGKLLGTASWGTFARIYTSSKLKQVSVLGYHESSVNTFEFRELVDGNDHMIALGGKDSTISLWNIF